MIYSLTVTNSIGESLTFELSNPWKNGYAIKTIDGLGTPDMNVNSTPYGIGDGSAFGSVKADYRLITIILYPLAFPTVETARQKLYRFFQIKKEIVLAFNTENRMVTIEGYVQSIGPNIFENPESISIEVKCLNPYFHKLANDQTKFYGILPQFEFPFSNEFEYDETNFDYNDIEWEVINLPSVATYKDAAYNPNDGGFYLFVSDYASYSGTRDFVNWIHASPSIRDMDSLGAIQVIPSPTTTEYSKTMFVSIYDNINQMDSIYPVWDSFSNREDLGLGDFSTKLIRYKIIEIFNGTAFMGLARESYPLVTKIALGMRPEMPDGEYVDVGVSQLYKHLYSVGDKLIGFTGSYTTRYMYNTRYASYGWTEAEFPKTGSWKWAGYINGTYVVLVDNGNVYLYSDDFVNWTESFLPYSGVWNSMVSTNNAIYITSGTRMLMTADGLTWTAYDLPDGYNCNAAVYMNGNYYILPKNGNIMLHKVENKIRYLDPIEFSAYTIDNRVEINYRGEIDAGIIITIECQTPPGDIIIYNVDTLERIQIFADRIEAVSGAPLGPKDIIEINTESGAKYVRLLRNGVYYNILGAMNRDMTWFTLKQGPNVFTYTTTDEHSAIAMNFSYRDTYAAI